MTTHTTMHRIAAAAITATLIVPSFAFAQSAAVDATVTSTATVDTPAGGAKVTLSAAVMTRAKTKADSEIDRRLKALTDLVTRINSMTKLTAEVKQSIVTNIQTHAGLLNTLKTSIDADTDGATLKADVQSITKSYRVYALLMPQVRIAAAADREVTIFTMLSELGAKLQARLQAAQQGGADVTALAAVLTDMGVKLGSAQTHAQAAVTGTINLTPDQGDATKMKANTAALQAGRTELKSAQQDLITARKDAETIIKGLKTLKVNAAASSTTQAQ